MRRIFVGERMDDPAIPRDELSAALGYLRVINRRLGGAHALLRHLRPWSGAWDRSRPVTMIDLGTGSADIPLAARAWALKRGFDLRITAIDAQPTTIELAREHVSGAPEAVRVGITLVHARAQDLVGLYGIGAFDYAHAGLFLHHLPDIEVATVLRVMDRLARAGIVWNDLVRSPLRRALVEPVLWLGNRTVRADGRASVRAGFTRREVLNLARRLDLDYARYHAGPLLHRFTFAGERPGAWRA